MAAKKIVSQKPQASIYASAILAGGLEGDDVEAHGMISEQELRDLIVRFTDLADSLTPAQRQVVRTILEAAAETNR
jgi:hypothetical protein